MGENLLAPEFIRQINCGITVTSLNKRVQTLRLFLFIHVEAECCGDLIWVALMMDEEWQYEVQSSLDISSLTSSG